MGVDFLSISTINYYDGKFHSDGNLAWYWAHAVLTWMFSGLVLYTLFRNYREYVALRADYFASDEYQHALHSRTLLILNVPSSLQSDAALQDWITSMNLNYPPQQVVMGRRSNDLACAVENHEQAVRQLENVLSNYLLREMAGKRVKRPQIRINKKWGLFGGEKVDAITYYTDQIQLLNQQIHSLRSNLHENKMTNYGWVSFAQPAEAHQAAKQLQQSPLLLKWKQLSPWQPTVLLAPQPKDIVWSNIGMNPHLRRSKRLIGSFFFYVFVFLFFIPSSLLSASSNVRSLLLLFPNGDTFVKHHKTFVSLLGSWFSPIIMALFFFLLPKALRVLSQQQGYMTKTSLDRQVLAKLYIFFIINHLLVFTVSSTLLAMYTQIQSAVQNGETLTAEQFFSTMGKNLTQVAKNIAGKHDALVCMRITTPTHCIALESFPLSPCDSIDVSTFWVNYVSLKGLGVIMDLAQVFALVGIMLR